MTIAWSSYAQGNDGNGLSVGIELEQQVPTTLAAKYYIRTEWNYADNQTLVRGGTVTGDVGFYNNSGGGGTAIHINTGGPLTNLTPGASYNFTAQITGSYNGASPFVSVWGYIPFSTPAAPSVVTPTRVSDQHVNLSWTRNATSAAPYHSQQVQRREYDYAWGGWATIATVSGDATSYADTTTRHERVYDYRIVAVNPAGSATGQAMSTGVHMTPYGPSGATANKSGTDITVAWTNGITYASYETQIEESTNGGSSWSLLHTVGNGVSQWTHVAPNAAVTHTYRVRHRTTAYVSGLASGYSTTGTVQLLTAPGAPTGLAPTSVRDADSNIAFAWTHNPVDTTAQTQFQVRHREQGAGTWTTVTAVVSGTSEWTLPAGTYDNGDVVEWQVATKGAHADFGPFSASAVFATSSTPTVSVSNLTDGGTVELSTLSVGWVYYQAEGSAQVSYHLTLSNSSGVVETVVGVGEGSSATFATTLPDGSSWTLGIQVMSAAGLSSAAVELDFTVSYALPPTPVAAVTWAPGTATAAISVTIPTPEGDEVTATSVDVFRSVDGEVTWEPAITGAPYTGGATVNLTDYMPRVAGATSYRVDAVSALPSRASSDIETIVTPETADPTAPVVWLSGGPSFSAVAHSGGDVDITRAAARERVLHEYAGRASVVEHTGLRRRRTWAVSCAVYEAPGGMLYGSAPEDWFSLDALAGPFLLRLADRDEYVYVSLQGPISVQTPRHTSQVTVHQVSFSVIEAVR